jgi:putative endonuclease
MAYFTYILFSEKASRYYYGQTNDLTKRLNRHNAGQVRSTKYATPWSLFAWKETLNRKEAIRLEKMLKNIHSTNFLESLPVRKIFRITTTKYRGF